MRQYKAKEILADEQTLDIAATAEAIQSEEKRKKKPVDKRNSIRAYAKWITNEQAKEAWRQRLKEVWNKRKKK